MTRPETGEAKPGFDRVHWVDDDRSAFVNAYLARHRKEGTG
jgi:hypothetical protein